MSKTKQWVAVDFDGTLSHYMGNHTIMGPPIPRMVQRVLAMIVSGHEVRIFTARAFRLDGSPKLEVIHAIEQWCLEYIGHKLVVTNRKDFNCCAIYDDKAVQVVKNTGWLVTPRGIKK